MTAIRGATARALMDRAPHVQHTAAPRTQPQTGTISLTSDGNPAAVDTAAGSSTTCSPAPTRGRPG